MRLKKLLCTMLSVIMTLSSFAVTSLMVSAEEATLPEAINGVITITEDVTLDETFVVEENQTLVIDLNGHTIDVGDANSEGKHIYAIRNKGNLTIVDSSEGHTGAIYARGIYNGVNGESNKNVVLTVNDAKIIAQDTNGGACIWGYGDASEIYLNGAILTGYTGVVSSEGYVEINGGTYSCYSGIDDDGNQLTSPTYNIRAYNGLKITDGEFTSRHGVVSLGGGEGFIEGGTYTIEFAAATTSNVVYVYNDAELTIENGDFISDNSANKADSGAAVVVSGNAAVLEINDGKFIGMNGMVSCNNNTVINGGEFDTVWDYNHYGSIESHISEGAVIKVADKTYTKTASGLEEIAKVSSYEELLTALEGDAKTIIMMNDIEGTATEGNAYGTTGINILNGETIDGNGFTLTINGAASTWDSAINITGGTIKNLTIDNGFRGIFVNHNGAGGLVTLENVTIDGPTYTISCDQGTNSNLIAINCTINGWTSYASTIGMVEFINCNFGEGAGYAFCRPYAPTKFDECNFDEGYEADLRATVALVDCKYNGEPITSENIGDLVGESSNKIATAYIQGKRGFESLEEALAALEDGDTLELATGTYDAFEILKDNVTIKGMADDTEITVNSTTDTAFIGVGGDNITIEGIKFIIPEEIGGTKSWLTSVIGYASSQYNYGGVEPDGWNVIDCDFVQTGDSIGIAIFNCDNFTVDGCTFENFGTGISSMGDGSALGTVAVTDNTFTKVNNPINVYWGQQGNENGSLTITGNTFVSAKDADEIELAIDDYASRNTGISGIDTLDISGNTYSALTKVILVDMAADITASAETIFENEDNAELENRYASVARIGNNKYYATFAAALEDAAEGDIIDLLGKTSTIDSTKTINKSITIKNGSLTFNNLEGRLFDVLADITFENVILEGEYVSGDSGVFVVWNSSLMTLKNSKLNVFAPTGTAVIYSELQTESKLVLDNSEINIDGNENDIRGILGISIDADDSIINIKNINNNALINVHGSVTNSKIIVDGAEYGIKIKDDCPALTVEGSIIEIKNTENETQNAGIYLKDREKMVDENTVINSNIFVEDGGEEGVILVTINFETNGGNFIPQEERTLGTTVNLSDFKPTKSRYSFQGWYLDSSLTEKVTELTLTEPVTLYAKWKKKIAQGGGGGTTVFTIEFETNGGSKVKKISKALNTTIDLEEYITEKEGFVFKGWYKDKEFENKVTSLKLTENLTLYAKWEESKSEENQILLRIGDKKAIVFGEEKTNDVAPIIRNNRTMLPARFVAEALGALVSWDENARKVVIKKEGIEIIIFIGEDHAFLNGEKILLDSPSFIENDRTYTPIRFISEALFAEVKWDEEKNLVTITKGEN